MNLQSVLSFLKELNDNNNREWFNENRGKYETAKMDFEVFMNSIIPGIYKIDPSIGTPDARKSIFRIFRDVRFSKNKLPYKTNFGGFIAKGGRKGGHAGYYVHVEPGKSFIGGGNYMPQSDALKAIRSEILYNVDEFKEVVSEAKFKKYFSNIEGEKLKRPPKGFPADFPDIELLKFKSYVAINHISDKQVLSDSFVQYTLKVFEILSPLNIFLNRAFD